MTVRDPDFKMVQVRANGLCVLRIADPAIFLREVIGTDSTVTTEEIAELLRRIITLAFSDMIMATGMGAIELQGRQVELSDKLRDFVQERVDDEFGLKIDSVTMNITLPEEITQAMTRGVARGVEQGAYLDNVGPMDRLQQGAAAEAMVEAAKNPGGGAGSFMGAGLGLALGQQMGNVMAGAQQGGYGQPQQGGYAPPAGPPPLPQAQTFHAEINGQAAGPFTDRSAAAVRDCGATEPELQRVGAWHAELGSRANRSGAGWLVRTARAAAPAPARSPGVTQGPPGPPQGRPPYPPPPYPPQPYPPQRQAPTAAAGPSAAVPAAAVPAPASAAPTGPPQQARPLSRRRCGRPCSPPRRRAPTPATNAARSWSSTFARSS